jgi:hypothetical protein
VRFYCVTSGSILTAGQLGQKHIGDGWPIRALLIRRSKSCWRKVSTRCVWGEQRPDRVDGYQRRQTPNWSLYPLVRNLCARRGFDVIVAAGVAAAIGDPSRFASAPDFMAYLGLVPSEQSSGPKRCLGGITKSGDIHARTLLIEASHCYRFPARVARHKLAAVDAVPDAVREIAWKAQTRLCQRFRRMMTQGKPKQVVVTAIARELAGFVWAIACLTSDPPANSSAVKPALEEVCLIGSTGCSHAPHLQPLKDAPRCARANHGRAGETTAVPRERKMTP